ncbi:SusF/SusE family outer membrane protein [Pedobacter chinensis]|uniref:SusF/SusE family outer membrane protein n=1 Tax=Pedobacter chinensis TaxID=2282421 RepID=A0A369PXK6_9SPHI|nr:SusE domain-containing protein [Pedobacter chinensis]RDC57353.1 SusF/SusE family outer membrane protein [Pedobacter chinensis]
MKSTFYKLLALSFIALSLWSCKKDETQTVASAGTGGSLKSSVTSVTLDKSVLETDVITFTTTNANFGYNAAITNVLQLAAKGTNFAQPKEAPLDVNVTSKSYNGLDFNNLLLALGLSTTTTSEVEIRLKSSISNAVAPVYSNVVTISAKPFPLTSWIYVPGNYQGWNPATADSLVSITGNGVYSGIIKFDGDNFKITPAKKWDIAYGNAGGGKLSTTGGDISSVSAGFKLLTVDLNTLVYTIADADYWSIIGNAIPGSNWDKDIDLKATNDGNNTWTTTVALTPGAFKFRRNHDWGTNIGDNGNDINVTSAGNYKLVLTLNADGKTGSYTMTKL